MKLTPGDDVLDLLGRAQRDVLIVAPFIRARALVRLLDRVLPTASITVVTRWRPADLLAGASDLDVFDLAQSRSVRLLLRHDLHAKLFAADDQCLVGSANVTDTALGWRTPANLELITPIARTAPSIIRFEEELLAGAVPATAQDKQRLRELVDRLASQASIVIAEAADDQTTPGLLAPDWVPRTMNPEELYLVYAGDGERVSRRALHAMHDELAHLGVAPGMSEGDFRAWVAATITQTPLIRGVTQRIEEQGAMTEPALEQLLAGLGVATSDYPAHQGLVAIQRWLDYFLPDQYQTTQDSIKIIRATNL